MFKLFKRRKKHQVDCVMQYSLTCEEIEQIERRTAFDYKNIGSDALGEKIRERRKKCVEIRSDIRLFGKRKNLNELNEMNNEYLRNFVEMKYLVRILENRGLPAGNWLFVLNF